jgi:hypothetical protein
VNIALVAEQLDYEHLLDYLGQCRQPERPQRTSTFRVIEVFENRRATDAARVIAAQRLAGSRVALF